MADRTLLRELFESWVERGENLSVQQWTAPTRLGDWTVTDLYAHMAADRTAFRKLLATHGDKPPVATSGGEVLRALNVPGGPAETLAPAVAERARAEAAAHTPRRPAGQYARHARRRLRVHRHHRRHHRLRHRPGQHRRRARGGGGRGDSASARPDRRGGRRSRSPRGRHPRQ
ncbi:maleylpyruvate isomerase N-terminal domain-containing protein [Nocardia crassostreae]|uniref:maleylpyruvate isomerase N-terminal domain-containing protein n=1 Tax=Nocardia crassostreae TaxID=53428 RepID=UPI0009FF542D